MKNGYICLVLHAHLPFVRHPEHEHFLEESWLFEAISETYLPLLRVFRRLKDDGVPFRLTVSVSPTLAMMLVDDLLQERYINHLTHLIALADRELERTAGDPVFYDLATMYRELFKENLEDFTNLYNRNILKPFRQLEREGHIEVITTAATHGFLPLLKEYPQAIEAQIQNAIISHGRIFGREPSGFWLPECGYYPDLERHLRAYGIKYFFTAAHGILFSESKAKNGVYAPMRCTNGVHYFGRDIPSSRAVWSSTDGYPADFTYRDFYRDIGHDLPIEYIGPWLHESEERITTGFKYYAVTGNTDNKKPYNRENAMRKVEEHAQNFVYKRLKTIDRLDALMDRPPIIVSPYDAELFGHWWFEGPAWIEHVLRKVSESDGLSMITPSEYLEKHPENQEGNPAFSSWGNKGYSEVWLDGSNDWVYRHVHKAIERMSELVRRFPDESGLKLRVLNQAAREVLLCQASDWPFIMKTGSTVPYATTRIKEHIFNFTKIYDGLCRNTVNTEWLTNLEKRNNAFPDVDYRVFGIDEG